MSPQTIKHKIYAACYGTHTSKASLGLQLGMSLLIALNTFAVVLETVEMFRVPWAKTFRVFELFSVTVFAIEYLVRVWVADLDARYQHSFTGRIRYIFTPMALVDLLAILPFFLAMAGFDLRVLRVLRLLRLFKLTRYSRAMSTLGGAIKASKEELILTVLVMGILLIISATLIYYAEHDAQPVAFSSIPASLWWAVVTLTTIGYGDVYPITVAGKIIAGISAIVGIGMFALPGGIIASELISRTKVKDAPACPHCGKKI
jgi:voltage-gated potassium channel